MKKITITAIILITIIPIIYIGVNMSPGSYANAEIYELKIYEKELIKAVEKFKELNPEYCVPDTGLLKDGRSNDSDDHWYHIYFYYKQENRIVYSWIRQADKNLTNFAFVSINEGTSLGNWKDINKDFSKEENKLQKKLFEERILNKIKKIASLSLDN